MQRYRSGHNGADSKSVCAHAHGGSNPPLCARKKHLPRQVLFSMKRADAHEASCAATREANASFFRL